MQTRDVTKAEEGQALFVTTFLVMPAMVVSLIGTFGLIAWMISGIFS